MEGTSNSKEVKKSLWYHVKMYLLGLAVYCGIGVVIGLFFMQHFRHFWISHHEEPLSAYTITGTDYDLEVSRGIDEDGKSDNDETYTYYLLLDVNGKSYKVETRDELYDRVSEGKATHFDMDEAKFYYDNFRDQVFLGGYYSDAFYIFLIAFVSLFLVLFVYIPIAHRKVYFSD